MQRFLKTGNARLYALLGALLLLAGTWRAGEAINLRLVSLPVKEAPRVDKNSVPIDAKSFYPVWVKQAAANPPIQKEGESESVEALFMEKKEPTIEQSTGVPVAPDEPDYVQMFQQAARVDGVSDDGAFINGRFYKVGQKMVEFQIYGAGGQSVIPVIQSVQNGKITFRIGNKTLISKQGMVG